MDPPRLRDVLCARPWAVVSRLRDQVLIEAAINQNPANHSLLEWG